jgi:hypothetical protein
VGSLLQEVTLITIVIGLVYWAVVILPQRGRAWNVRQAAIDEEHPHEQLDCGTPSPRT